MKKAISGFTIVELLVVIIVIAILATISVMTYRGVVQRAKSVQVVANMDGWAKSLQMVATFGEQWPGVITGTNQVSSFFCLGEASDFPADSVFAEVACVKYEYDSGFVFSYIHNEAEFASWPAGIDRPSGQAVQTKIRQSGSTVTIHARGFLGVRMRYAGQPETFHVMYFPQTQGACAQGYASSPNTVGSLEGETCSRTFTR